MTVAQSRDDAQMRRSVVIAALLFATWAVLHIGGIFFWEFRRETAWLVPVLVLAQAWVCTGLFIIAHDSMHGSFAPGRPRLNTAVGTVALAVYACLNFRDLRGAHFLHHKHAGLEGDPDFHAGRPRDFVPWLLRFFGGYYTHTQLAWLTLVAILYMGLGGAWIGNIVVFWAFPALLAMLQLFYFGTYLPHRHRDDPFPDRHRARSNGMGRAAALVSCYNFGAYHHEHHLWPDTPWWGLPSRRPARASAEAGLQRTL